MSEHDGSKQSKAHSGCKAPTEAEPPVAATKGKANERSGGEPQAAPEAAAKKAAKKGCCG